MEGLKMTPKNCISFMDGPLRTIFLRKSDSKKVSTSLPLKRKQEAKNVQQKLSDFQSYFNIKFSSETQII